MNRRTFLKAGDAELLMAPSLVTEAVSAREPSVISVAERSDYAAITRRAIHGIGGMKRFVSFCPAAPDGNLLSRVIRW